MTAGSVVARERLSVGGGTVSRAGAGGFAVGGALFEVADRVGDVQRLKGRMHVDLQQVIERHGDGTETAGDVAAYGLGLRTFGAYVGGGSHVHVLADWWRDGRGYDGVTLCGIVRPVQVAMVSGPECLRCRYVQGGRG